MWELEPITDLEQVARVLQWAFLMRSWQIPDAGISVPAGGSLFYFIVFTDEGQVKLFRSKR
jgi:hypothetical protein